MGSALSIISGTREKKIVTVAVLSEVEFAVRGIATGWNYRAHWHVGEVDI